MDQGLKNTPSFQALMEITACLPVYRTYIQDFETPLRDRPYMESALHEAQAHNPAIPGIVFDFVRRVLWLDFPDSLPVEQREQWLQFVRQWQQLTGPVMAKGFEDTTLYVYNRLISLNDVGCDPDPSGLFIREFHYWNQRRLKDHPYTLNATSTHDTKRSEDVRARIHVLSELAEEWGERLDRWKKANQDKKKKIGVMRFRTRMKST